MTILKSLVDSGGWIEATWVERTQRQDTIVPETEETPAHTVPGDIVEAQVWCQSYHPTQIDMLRAKAAEYGTPLDEYEAMLADWVASYVPPVPQPEPVPQQITRAQGKAALIMQGHWQEVLDYVAAITDPTQRALADVALHDTLTWERSSPFLNATAAGLGMTDEQLDALFIQASKITL